jgi:hypothetical protein
MTERKRQTIQWPKEKDRQYNDPIKLFILVLFSTLF